MEEELEATSENQNQSEENKKFDSLDHLEEDQKEEEEKESPKKEELPTQMYNLPQDSIENGKDNDNKHTTTEQYDGDFEKE